MDIARILGWPYVPMSVDDTKGPWLVCRNDLSQAPAASCGGRHRSCRAARRRGWDVGPPAEHGSRHSGRLWPARHRATAARPRVAHRAGGAGTRPPRHHDHPRQPGVLARRGRAGYRRDHPVPAAPGRPRPGPGGPITPTPCAPAAIWPAGSARPGRSPTPPPSSGSSWTTAPASWDPTTPTPRHPQQPSVLAGTAGWTDVTRRAVCQGLSGDSVHLCWLKWRCALAGCDDLGLMCEGDVLR